LGPLAKAKGPKELRNNCWPNDPELDYNHLQLDIHRITFIIMLSLVAVIIGLAKGGMGGILGSLATPLLSLVMPPGQVLGLLLPLLMLADLPAVWLYWRQWEWKWIRLMLPGAVFGILLGTIFVISVPGRTLQVVLGVIVLLFTFYKVMEKRILAVWHYQTRTWHGVIAGTLSGVSSALAHNGGPPVAIYLLMQDGMSIPGFNATCAIFFAILNLIKLPFYFYAGLFDGQLLLSVLWVVPLLPLGVWIGIWVSRRLDQRVYEGAIVALLGLTAVLLIFV
jgi:uncharacterized membrane protein YfcA